MLSLPSSAAGMTLQTLPLSFDVAFAVVGLAAVPVLLALILFYRRTRPR